MAQLKTRHVSADEAQSKAGDRVYKTDKGLAVMKAAKAPASWDEESRSARFVMTSQAVDRYGDIVVTNGLDTAEFERNPVGILFHNSRTWPVANWANLEKMVRTRPARMEGDFVLLPSGGPIKEIEETEWMLANGGIRACSIGFVPDWDEIEFILDEEEKWTGGILFAKSELVECSICAVPANAGALVKSADGDMRLAKEMIEDILDNWAKTPEGLLLPRSDFEAQYRVTTEAVAADKSALKSTDAPSDGMEAVTTETGKPLVLQGGMKFVDAPEAPDAEGEKVAARQRELETRLDAFGNKMGEGLIEALAKRIGKMFGLKAAEPPPEPPAPPSAEEIAAAKSLAAETRARIAPKIAA